MGKIIYWAMIRSVFLIAALWLLIDLINYKFWWIIVVLAIYAVIIHPAIIQYRQFQEENEEVINDTLCSKCKHFESSAVLCLKYDEHPTAEYIPCGGIDWEPK